MKKKLCAGCRKQSCDGCQWNLKQKLHTNKEDVSGLQTTKEGPRESGAFERELRKSKAEGFGFVFDVGTTTVAGYLWDLQTGRCLCAGSIPNPQRDYGSDVVSRLTYCMEQKADGLADLQKLILEKLDELAKELLTDADCKAPVLRVVILGNTAMCSITAGLPVDSLGKAPFRKPYEGSIRYRGGEFGFVTLANAEVIILPAVEGYVGADALSLYQYIKSVDERKNILAVDIGTNGEIILIGEKKVYACSTAAGPALEGGAASQGMCAAFGAIEGVTLAGAFPREDICTKVIGGGPAKGICGSGLVDALAVLLEQKIVDKEGYLRSSEEARKAGTKERLCRRIEEGQSGRRFLLTDAESPVYLAANDIRELQLAKGAISAAIRLMLEKAGISAQDLSGIYLAGAFGSYISLESAVKIGLLPMVDAGKMKAVGNGAAFGAVAALFLDETIQDMEQAATRIEHVELAGEPNFEKYFVEEMTMP